MSNIPPWFLQAVEYGTVEGKPIPKWFPKENTNVEMINKYTGGDGKPVFSNNLDLSGFPKTTAHPFDPTRKTVGNSFYLSPIVEREHRGNTRAWGDADDKVKSYVYNALIEEAKAKGFDNEDIALLLAIVNVESGFNPDAASNLSSASGLGQFINATAKGYGINDKNRWDVAEQIRAVVEHFSDNKKLAEAKGGREWVYAYHHDGPSLSSGGINISRDRVMPLAAEYLKAISGTSDNNGSTSKTYTPTDIKTNTSMKPLFTLDGSQSPKVSAHAEDNMNKVLQENFSKMQEYFGKDIIVNDAIAKKGTSREKSTPGSQHFHGKALDLSIRGMSDEEKLNLVRAAKKAGFTGFGFGNTILHVDVGPSRYWTYNKLTKFGGKPVFEVFKIN